ncbi:Putative MetA-pathway of phenol degradation [Flavobacterium resistens]|uniref:MetA-pathway of phenol degradation n=1 Tax=Flavobacterium resistens TaxID=443612 RepID=A0A521DII6_9FLAO|nr:transporter [Flavobacterium resistens]MRX68755.1 transporter [Flavobacterium resistens]SMO71564.1 Putative MetA-pathway of phenol degradation [Flavobacterium resistens]
MPKKYFCATLLLFSIISYGQDLEPRAYANVPKKLNVAALGYVFMDGNVVTEPSLPISDFKIQSHNIAASYIRTFGLANKLARIQVSLPFTFMDGSALVAGDLVTGSRTGFADTKVRFGINLLGSPALDKSEFRAFQQKTILGVSLVTSIPTGRYYDDKRVNIGTNRWGIKPEIGISKRFAHVYAEAYGGVWFYTDNNDFLGKRLEQKPTYSLQAHASYYFKNQMWVGFNTTWFFGGKTIIDGVPEASQIDNWRVGGTFSTPIAKGQSIRFQYHVGAFTNNGLDYYALSAVYQYSFF